MKKEHLVIIIGFLATFILVRHVMAWDEYVYLMNAETISGKGIYFENQRPPILPLILSIFYSLNIETLVWIMPPIIYASVLILQFFFAKKFVKQPITNTILFMSCPILIVYANKYVSSILGTLFFLSSILLLYKYSKKDKDHYLYSSFLLASLTTLTRYPLGLVYPSLTVLYFIFCKKDWRKIILSQMFFWAPIFLWVFFIGFDSIMDAFLWSSYETNPLLYITSSPFVLGTNLLLIPLIFSGYKYEKKDWWFLTPLIILLFFFQIFNNKEPRFLIPVLPYIIVLIDKSFKNKNKLLIAAIFLTMGIISAMLYTNSLCEQDYSGIRHFFNEKNTTIMSNFWPLCSYYTRTSCLPLAYNYSYLSEWISINNASYILVWNQTSCPPYSNNFSMFEQYELQKIINSSCNEIRIYEV